MSIVVLNVFVHTLNSTCTKVFLDYSTFLFLNVCCVLLLYVFLCCSVCLFCMGHFVMVPLNKTCVHCLQHYFIENLFNLYYISTYSQYSTHACLARCLTKSYSVLMPKQSMSNVALCTSL